MIMPVRKRYVIVLGREKGYRRYRLFKRFYTSNIEIRDLAKGWFMISLAFAIAFNGLNKGLAIAIPVAGLAVGTAFVFHELSHKFMAQKYRYPAEFRSFDEMLFLALIMSFFGFVFAAPGAVMIQSYAVNKEKNGRIAAAGPMANLIMAALFLIIFAVFIPQASGVMVGRWGLDVFLIKVNAFIAGFNLIPVWLFDGAKIFKWSKPVWFMMLGAALALMFLV